MIFKDFLAFLREYKIVTLAIAFVMGTAATALINSLVKDMVLPVLLPILSVGGSWKDATLTLGPVKLAYGSFLAELLNFLILALVVFFITKKLIKEEKKDGKI